MPYTVGNVSPPGSLKSMDRDQNKIYTPPCLSCKPHTYRDKIKIPPSGYFMSLIDVT